jgi:hypothetical protein
MQTTPSIIRHSVVSWCRLKTEDLFHFTLWPCLRGHNDIIWREELSGAYRKDL